MPKVSIQPKSGIMRKEYLSMVMLVAGGLIGGCGNGNAEPGSTGAGGSTSAVGETGGAVSSETGGVVATGGATQLGTGGAANTSATATGGAEATGGARATGGASVGTGGARATGGAGTGGKSNDSVGGSSAIGAGGTLAGGGAVSTWDFTDALKFWTDGQHANHGFFLYGDGVDYMSMFTPLAKDAKTRPAILVVYEPKG